MSLLLLLQLHYKQERKEWTIEQTKESTTRSLSSSSSPTYSESYKSCTQLWLCWWKMGHAPTTATPTTTTACLPFLLAKFDSHPERHYDSSKQWRRRPISWLRCRHRAAAWSTLVSYWNPNRLCLFAFVITKQQQNIKSFRLINDDLYLYWQKATASNRVAAAASTTTPKSSAIFEVWSGEFVFLFRFV